MPALLPSVAAAAVLLVLSAEPAAAYIDPGHGSLFLQYLIGLLFGALIYVRNSVRKLVSGVLRKLRDTFRT